MMCSTWSSERATADHTANLLGALALTLSDRNAEAVSAAATGSPSDATSLSALRDSLHGPSIDVPAQVLGRQGLAQAVAAARLWLLLDALRPISAEDHRTLDRLLCILLTGLIREPGAQCRMCRLCDTAACGRSAGQCPVAENPAETTHVSDPEQCARAVPDDVPVADLGWTNERPPAGVGEEATTTSR